MNHRVQANNNFDGLRLVGALLVLLSHQFAVAGRWEPRFVGDHSFGNLGVLMFFSMSGYLVAASWQADPHPWRFFQRRLLRLWPGLAVVVILGALLAFAWATDYGESVAAMRYLSNLGFISFDLPFFRGSPNPLLNGPLWTIPLEASCYVALVVLAMACGTKVRQALILVCILLLAAYLFIVGGQAGLPGFLVRGRSAFLAYFGLFFIIGALLRFYPVAMRRAHVVTGLLLGLLLTALGESTLALWVAVPIVTIWVGRQSWPVLRGAARFGDLSYGIYLYAWPLQQIVTLLLGNDAPYLFLLACSIVPTLACAWLSWHLIEHRALGLKPVKPPNQVSHADREGAY